VTRNKKVKLSEDEALKNDNPVSSEPRTQGKVDIAQIAWDFLSKHSK